MISTEECAVQVDVFLSLMKQEIAAVDNAQHLAPEPEHVLFSSKALNVLLLVDTFPCIRQAQPEVRVTLGLPLHGYNRRGAIQELSARESGMLNRIR